MRILITGGAGFIGSHVAEALIGRGDEVVVVDNFDGFYAPALKRENVAALGNEPRFSLHEIDIRDGAELDRIFAAARPECVVHAAALGGVRHSIRNPSAYVATNVQGTQNVLAAARNAGVRQVVFASSSSVYGGSTRVPHAEDDPCDHPLSPYAATKRSGELLGHVQHSVTGIDFTALRFFSVYGPRGRPDMMPYVIGRSLIEGTEITLFENGSLARDWTWVGDVVEGVLAAIDRPMGYEIVNLGSGRPVATIDLVGALSEISGLPAGIRSLPAPGTEAAITCASIEKGARLLGYAPQMPIAEGLERFWRWYRRSRGKDERTA